MDAKTKSRGRPRAYDPDEALDQAARVFWTRGFDGASLDDLSAAMGMARPSIYRAFGDKEQLFLRALARYQQTTGSGPLAAFDAEDSIEAAISAFFAAVIDYTTADGGHLGCLLSSVAVASDLASVREFLREKFAELEQELTLRLRAAVQAGQLPESYPVEVAARRAVGVVSVLAVRARIGIPREELDADAAAAAAAVLHA